MDRQKLGIGLFKRGHNSKNNPYSGNLSLRSPTRVPKFFQIRTLQKDQPKIKRDQQPFRKDERGLHLLVGLALELRYLPVQLLKLHIVPINQLFGGLNCRIVVGAIEDNGFDEMAVAADDVCAV